MVDVSKRSGPERNLLPSGDTARVGEITATLRLARTVDAAASKTNTVRVLLASRWTPIMILPTAEAWRRAFAARYMMPLGGGNCAGAGAGGATVTDCSAFETFAAGS